MLNIPFFISQPLILKSSNIGTILSWFQVESTAQSLLCAYTRAIGYIIKIKNRYHRYNCYFYSA